MLVQFIILNSDLMYETILLSPKPPFKKHTHVNISHFIFCTDVYNTLMFLF